jgi:hypothetical protein
MVFGLGHKDCFLVSKLKGKDQKGDTVEQEKETLPQIAREELLAYIYPPVLKLG